MKYFFWRCFFWRYERPTNDPGSTDSTNNWQYYTNIADTTITQEDKSE